MSQQFYIVDVRREWQHRPYITVWRPNNANYAYPLSWAGKYTLDQVEDGGTYYFHPRFETKKAMDRYPVPCDVVERFAIDPQPGIIDGDAGPVIPNTTDVRRALRKAAFRPASVTKERELSCRGLA